MRTPSLQYLYLQKPVTMVIILCMISVLPWIGRSSFIPEVECEQVIAASTILETGEWVLPKDVSGNFICNPPMAQWLIAAFSLPQGYVSAFTAHLPSALALIFLIGFTLFFFGERIKFQEAFISSFLLLTSMGILRAGIVSHTDMLFTTFVVLALYALYRWENKLELKGLPIVIPILLGCAVLTKGLTGILLPLFIYGIYLFILKKHRLGVIFKVLLYIAVSSMFLPLMWYVAAWKEIGGDLLKVVLSSDYTVGIKRGILYNVGMLAGGFMPWTLFFFFSLFGIKLHALKKTSGNILLGIRKGIRSLDKIKLFSLVVFICIFCYFSIYPVKKSAYMLPAYPFLAVFLAQYAIYLTEYRTKVTRVFALFSLLVIIPSLTILILHFTNITEISYLTNYLQIDTFCFLHWVIIFVVLISIITLMYQLFKKINIKILYATIALTFAINLLINSII